MALAIASGADWLGRKTLQRPILYVAAEGVLGMKLRIQAHQERFGLNDDNVRFIGLPFNVRDTVDVDAILAAIDHPGFKPNLIIVDTLARVAVGADENSAKDMGQVVDGLERIKRETGATVLVVHHSRKNDLVERGSSALRGAADVMIACDPFEGADGVKGADLKCEKMKDDEPFKDFAIQLEKVELAKGKSSLVVNEAHAVNRAPSDHGKKIIELLRSRFAKDGATHKELKEAFVENGKSGSTFSRALQELKNSGRVMSKKINKSTRYFAVPDDLTGDAGQQQLQQLFADIRQAKSVKVREQMAR
jgi:putative DNA primase/helicase